MDQLITRYQRRNGRLRNHRQPVQAHCRYQPEHRRPDDDASRQQLFPDPALLAGSPNMPAIYSRSLEPIIHHYCIF